MKIDRLIGILSVLLQQEKVTAPYLAEKFEVSRRTINRDIEELCKAGIPIVTAQGQNGGISIMEGYRIDRALLTKSDMRAILTGLQSLDSVCGGRRYQQLMEKLSAGNTAVLSAGSHIMINLSSWYKPCLAPKIELIQEAIEQRAVIGFDYFAPKGESRREIEPYLLIFHWSSWYVWGYCLEKQSFRLFKLNRMLNLKSTGRMYQAREAPPPDLSPEKVFPAALAARALFEPSMKWRLIEEYGADSFTEQSDGRLLFCSGFADKGNLFGWLLGFGDQVELVSPKELRNEFASLINKLSDRYGERSLPASYDQKEKEIDMEYEIVNLNESPVVGLCARTNNLAPDMGAVIGGLWNRFYGTGVYDAIRDKSDERALGIYTDYAEDERQDYTIVVGCRVTGRGEPPAGTVTRTIPAGRYAKFVVKGDLHQAVAEFWKQLWDMDLPRAFNCDFEEYQNGDMEHAEIHIYIGLTA